MGTRGPTGKGKPGKIKSVDAVYDVIDHELKPYKPRFIDAAAISDKIIRKRHGVKESTPSPEAGKTYIKKPEPKK